MDNLKYEKEYLKKYLHEGEDYEAALKRLINGEPVQYIVGDVNFYGNLIKVNKNVLIPRRETEELVEKTTNYLKNYFPGCKKILEIGTGSGCIAITLKKLFPKVNIIATDISEKAISVAVDNSLLNGVEVEFLKSDLFKNVNGKYDCIISNPPYIAYDEPIMDIVKNNEPHEALYAEKNGLYFYEEILKQAKPYLNEKFIIAFEIGETQGNNISQMAAYLFPKAKVILEKDLQHLDRFIFVICE